MASRFCKPKIDSPPTRFLYVSGAGDQLGTNPSLLMEVFGRFGELAEDRIEFIKGKRFCFIIYVDTESAIRARDNLSDTSIPELGEIKVHIKFAAEVVPSQGIPEPECTSTTEHTSIPGMSLVENFINEDEETILLDHSCSSSAPWEQSLNRRVQHFGFTFNYRTLMLDYGLDVPNIPPEIASLIERAPYPCTQTVAGPQHRDIKTQNAEFKTNIAAVPFGDENVDSEPAAAINKKSAESFHATQLTLNEYYAGQGIAPHIDTSTCFGPIVYILSVGSGVTMTFQLRKPISEMDPEAGSVAVAAVHQDLPAHGIAEALQQPISSSSSGKSSSSSSMTGGSSSSPWKSSSSTDLPVGTKKHVWLPRRSLLIMTGPARYNWSHGIASRFSDKVDGRLVERSRRVSLTFREAVFPGGIPSSRLCSSDVERDHVFRVYDNIAVHWNHTRGKRKVHWHRVKAFLEELPQGSLLADIGSGDGKYFGLNPKAFVVGCDRSIKLLEVSKEPTHETFCCDAVKLPLLSDAFDATICIAVLHHLASVDRRAAVIRELLRITKPGGEVMLQAWALEQGEASRHNFEQQDVMVPWRLQKRFFQDGHVAQVSEGASTATRQASSGSSDKSSSGQGGAGGTEAGTETAMKVKSRKVKMKPRKKKGTRYPFLPGQSVPSPGEQGIVEEVYEGEQGDIEEEDIAIESGCNGSSDSQNISPDTENSRSGNDSSGNIEYSSNSNSISSKISFVATEGRRLDIVTLAPEAEAVLEEVRSSFDDASIQTESPPEAATDTDANTDAGAAERGNGSDDAITAGSRVSDPDCVISRTDQSPSVEHKISDNDEKTQKKKETEIEKEKEKELFPEGRCEHVVEEDGQLVFQRYCHVYREGELEDICSSIPNCRLLESGWDKGNWFVRLVKVEDARLAGAGVGEAAPVPPPTRLAVKGGH